MSRFVASHSALVRFERRAVAAHRAGLGRARASVAASDPYAADISRLRHDLAASQRRVAELEALAETDPLCQVLNRRGFDRELNRALAHVARYGGSVGLLMIDLDGFKGINDRLGHAAGDRLLAAAAECLTGDLRMSDTVARLGGDEFAAIIHNINAVDAVVKAQRVENLLTDRLRQLAADDLVGASCGSAIAAAGESAEALLARADLAMYVRKSERKAPVRR